MVFVLLNILFCLICVVKAIPSALQFPMETQSICNRTELSCHWNGVNVDACCSPKYGLVVFTLQWVPGYGPRDEFTIHGLWPDTCNGGRAPRRGCDRTRISNNIGNIIKSKNSTLYQQMQTFWPSYKGDNNWFWSHEWNVHGTCVSTLLPRCYGEKYTKYDDVIEYFQQTLDLQYDYDLYGVLNLAGVSPGRTYRVETMLEAIEKAFGARAKIDCDRSGNLSEIGLFFYVEGRKNYKITNAFHKGSCQSYVNYPKKY
ncbi:ribonuclease T2-like protein [Cunninghamella echinulata]|nr:ribonuclease T2-like protein [Cunninghamella echinulata]